jgi:uncharacterized protein (TIGR00299 family) protein
VLYFDCFSGASGDMVLGALIDAGVRLDDVRGALGSLAIDADAVWTERVTRTGISATRFCVRDEEANHDRTGDEAHVHAHDGAHAHAHAHGHGRAHTHEHGHPHEHEAGLKTRGHEASAEAAPKTRGHIHEPEHGHRTLAEIARLIDGSALSTPGKARAKALFSRLGEVEAGIHDIPVERVHLHEVGALDSIIDIVGAVYALEAIGVDRIVASPLNVGSGTVRSAHGLYPVPAPATLQLLAGVPIYAGAQTAELVTPTGALLVTGYATAYGPLPRMRVERVGYGAGTRDFVDTPNVLRVVIGEWLADSPAATGAAPAESAIAASAAPPTRVSVIEAEIDDMSPQIFGVLMDRLLAQGALDVFYTPVQMKKNRPGTLLTVIAPLEARQGLSSLIFRETTTIGIRYRESDRECLERHTVIVHTAVGDIPLKVARRDGEVLNVAPEFDDCVRAATASGRPVKDVQALALRAFFDHAEGA